jgi:GNAT superfamily N-acetyltransferase
MLSLFPTEESYAQAVATSAACLAWDELQPKGLVVVVRSAGVDVTRAMLGTTEFSWRLREDVVDPDIGGSCQGVFGPHAYAGLVEQAPNQVAYLIDPIDLRGGDAVMQARLTAEWSPASIPQPDCVDSEAWMEYGFPRASRTVVVSREDQAVGFGCIIPFHPGVSEAAILVESSKRGQGIGRFLASVLFDEIASQGHLCHWSTLAQNAPSRRLAHLRRVVYEVSIRTYLWS